MAAMIRESIALVAMAVLVGACGARDVPANAGSAVPRSVAPPAASTSVLVSTAPAVSVASQSPPPSAPPLPDEYADCTVVRRANESGLTPFELAAARGDGWLWPPRCGQVSGWAGISISMSTQATAFSADGKRFVACGAWGDVCDVLDLARDTVVQRVTTAWPDGLDGSPVTATPPVKKLFQELGAPAPEGRFPYADDLRVSWKVANDGSVLYVSLVLLATGEERIVHRFPGRGTSSSSPIVLQGASLSPDGGVLALDVFTAQGGSGFQVALVNLHAEAAALFRSAAAAGGANDWTRKATGAERRGRALAPSFVE